MNHGRGGGSHLLGKKNGRSFWKRNLNKLEDMTLQEKVGASQPNKKSQKMPAEPRYVPGSKLPMLEMVISPLIGIVIMGI